MKEPDHPQDDPRGELAARIAAVVGAIPGIAALHGGTFGDIVSYLPGGKLTGVRVGRIGEPVEVAVVVGLDRPIPAVVADVRRAVTAVHGAGPVDVTVADVRVAEVPAAVVLDEPAQRRAR